MQAAFLFKMKRNIFLLAVVLAIAFCSCSRKATGIYKTWSFYEINSPGTIPVDDNGNQIGKTHDTVRIFYIETKNNFDGSLERAEINGWYYSGFLRKEDSVKLTVGNSLPDDKPVIISARRNNKLWMLEIWNRQPERSESFKDYIELYIAEHENGLAVKRVILKLKVHTELVPELHY